MASRSDKPIATNLRDSAPFGSLHRAGIASDALQSWPAVSEQMGCNRRNSNHCSTLG